MAYRPLTFGPGCARPREGRKIKLADWGETVQLLRCDDDDSLAVLKPGSILCHDIRDPAQTRTVVLRKGRRMDEADITRNLVSWISPIARALMKAREGDAVEVRTPHGKETIEVVSIRYGTV